MKVRANLSFAGEVSMTEGEVKEIAEGFALSDLLRCGYVSPEPADCEVKEDEAERVHAPKRKKSDKS